MSYFVLVDCNNFYASCERLFRPDLEKKPVIVLSNNDGCVVARSEEAKKLNIGMGKPFFMVKDICTNYGVSVCSSNYQLYGEISGRVMSILTKSCPEIQVYSIDEAFLKFPSFLSPQEIKKQCSELRQTILKWTGIPTSIGIAPTKTLAKAANLIAKKDRLQGVFDLSHISKQEEVLRLLPVEEIWGIGFHSAVKLKASGIYTAWHLRESEPSFIKKKLGVVGERILLELKGISCLPLEESENRKSIMHSRCFSKQIKDLQELSEALSFFASLACQKLRLQGGYTKAVCVYIQTSLSDTPKERSYDSMTVCFEKATNDTSFIISRAKECLKKMFKEGSSYRKCGILLLDIVLESEIPLDLFQRPVDAKRKELLKTLDQANAKFGKETLFFAATGIDRSWQMRSEKRSGQYTTNWNELAVVKA